MFYSHCLSILLKVSVLGMSKNTKRDMGHIRVTYSYAYGVNFIGSNMNNYSKENVADILDTSKVFGLQ
jgi:hypothetical protein